jgi:hypothetical protein
MPADSALEAVREPTLSAGRWGESKSWPTENIKKRSETFLITFSLRTSFLRTEGLYGFSD